MVLIVKRVANMALFALLPVGAMRAQRGPTEIRSERPVLFGFALGCVECTPGQGARGRIGGNGGATEPAVWLYRRYPQVEDVIPTSSAESAGIRVGDVLKAIDGLSLITDEGARRMSLATAGELVRLSFERGSQPFDVSLKLGPVVSGPAGRGKELTVSGHMTGRMPTPQGDIEIDLWSDKPVRLSRDSLGAMVFKLGDAIVRVRIPEALRDSIGGGRSGERGRGKPDPFLHDIPHSN